MDVQGIQRLAARLGEHRRSWLTVGAGCLALTAIVSWTVWQSRLTREAIRRADVAEHTAAQARSEIQQAQARLAGEERPRKDRAVRRSQHADPEQIARMKKLYEEVDGLARIQDRVDNELSTIRRIAVRRAKAAATMKPPASSPSQ